MISGDKMGDGFDYLYFSFKATVKVKVLASNVVLTAFYKQIPLCYYWSQSTVPHHFLGDYSP